MDRKLLQIDDCSNKNIEINIILLKILFDNILTNAHKYGFDAIEETNTVMIELAIVENQLEIAIKNNGKPFPNNFDKEKFISKFSSTNNQKGTGIGGYDINRIATYFGNDDWALELNSNPIYPVIFKFLFPIKNAINEQ
ncbi:ATP-binding protein [Flavobacterium sp. XS1P32]|uniref:ATP-binding protein n=1 Tax=Flavobacterium sp. XS1P32 TaxID=3401726 RepID=UPI003AAE99FE